MDALLTILIPLLIQVESSGNPNAIGDGGKAVGILQIHKCVVDDVNRIYKKNGYKYDYDMRKIPELSIDMCQLYLTHYGKAYEKKTGKKADIYILASMWCAGPDGYKQIKTNKNVQNYIEKVKKVKNERDVETN